MRDEFLGSLIAQYAPSLVRMPDMVLAQYWDNAMMGDACDGNVKYGAQAIAAEREMDRRKNDPNRTCPICDSHMCYHCWDCGEQCYEHLFDCPHEIAYRNKRANETSGMPDVVETLEVCLRK